MLTLSLALDDVHSAGRDVWLFLCPEEMNRKLTGSYQCTLADLVRSLLLSVTLIVCLEVRFSFVSCVVLCFFHMLFPNIVSVARGPGKTALEAPDPRGCLVCVCWG